MMSTPPLAALREELVTSLYTYLGREGNLLDEQPTAAHLIKLKQPILTDVDLEKLRQISVGKLRAETLPMVFPEIEGAAGLAKALDDLCQKADAAVRGGAAI